MSAEMIQGFCTDEGLTGHGLEGMNTVLDTLILCTCGAILWSETDGFDTCDDG